MTKGDKIDRAVEVIVREGVGDDPKRDAALKAFQAYMRGDGSEEDRSYRYSVMIGTITVAENAVDPSGFKVICDHAKIMAVLLLLQHSEEIHGEDTFEPLSPAPSNS